jgi:DNA repair protein RAD5
MIECPERLTTGVSLIISMEVYLSQKAFKCDIVDAQASKENEKRHVFFSEGTETLEEVVMRERKDSILRLFDMVNLRPVAGVNHKNKKSEAQLHKESLQKLSQAKTRTEIVGDGEEIEVDDEENISKNDLNMIYQR